MSADATDDDGEDINNDCDDYGNHNDRGGDAGRGTGPGDVASGGDATMAIPATSATAATAATQQQRSICRPRRLRPLYLCVPRRSRGEGRRNYTNKAADFF